MKDKYNSCIGVIPGFEDIENLNPHSENKTKRKYRDIEKISLLKGLISSGLPYDIPIIKRCKAFEVLSKSLAFNEARAIFNKKKSLRGYFIHFFINDPLFECVRRNPKRYIQMFKSADFIVGPDYSMYRNYPFPIILKNYYDGMLLSAYYQLLGVKVIPNAGWISPQYYDLTVTGIPTESVISVSSNCIDRRDKQATRLWRHGYKETIKRLKPLQVIRFGKIIPGEEEIFKNPIRKNIDNPYISRMLHAKERC